MATRFSLFPNHMTSDPGDYYAVVQPARTRTNDDIADRIVQMGSTVTMADIASVLEDRDSVVRTMLLDGDRVKTSLVSLCVVIKGVFDGPQAPFDASKHQFNVTATPLRALIAWIQGRASAEQVTAVFPEPQLLRFTDVLSGEMDSVITPGSVGSLIGRLLKFDPGDPQQGVFFVAADGTDHKVETMVKNLPAESIFIMPTLAAGNYGLEVRALLKGNTEIRAGALRHTLTVS